MGLKSNKEYLQGLHDGWVKELNKPLAQRCLNKNGEPLDDKACQAFINLFKILVKEKEGTR